MPANAQTADLSARIGSIRIAMFTTTDGHGHLVAHPMTCQDIDDDGYLWFFTSDETELWQNVAANAQVNLAFSDPAEGVYVSVSGHAEQVRDSARMRALWTPVLEAWFPKGLGDERLALVKVHAHTAEYWDAHASRMVRMFRIAKAAVTGHPPPGGFGEHGTIRIN